MASGTDTAPELTAEQVESILVRPLEAASVFLASGPRIFDTDGSPVRIPKLTGMAEPSWHGENEAITEVDPNWDEITLLPTGMKSVKSLTRYSNELARQSVIALEQALRDRMVRDVAAKIDSALVAGDGADDTPTGLLNYTGTQEITGVGAVDLDTLHDAVGLAWAEHVDSGSLRWFLRSETFVALRKLKDSQDRYQLQPDPTQEGAFRLLGIPVAVTNRIPIETGTPDTTEAFLADFSQIAVARDLQPSVRVLDQTFADSDQQAIRVVTRYDAAPMNPEAIVVLRGIEA